MTGRTTKGTITLEGVAARRSPRDGSATSTWMPTTSRWAFSYTTLVHDLKPGKPKGFTTFGTRFPTAKTVKKVQYSRSVRRRLVTTTLVTVSR